MQDINTVISIGIVHSSSKNYSNFDFTGLHSYIASRFKYYEIIIIANPSELSPVDENRLLGSPNTRMLVINDVAPDDILRKKIFESAIGDYVVLYDPSEAKKEVIEEAIESNMNGYDFTGVLYKDDILSVYAILNRIFFFFASKLSGFRLNNNLSYTGCYSRALIEVINNADFGQNYLRLLWAATGFRSNTIVGAVRSTSSLLHLLSRLSTGLNIIGSEPHRLLQLTSWLSLGACLGNFFYLGYVLVIWFFAPNVQPGWTTTSLTQSIFLSILFFALFVFSSIFSSQLDKKTHSRFSIVRDVSSSEMISSSNILNVTDKQ